MNWLLGMFRGCSGLGDWLEGAGMVLALMPPGSERELYISSDFDALCSDWQAIAEDLRGAMDKEKACVRPAA